MPIEFLCPSCGKTLRVADKYVGKKAKCPKCATVTVAPDPSNKLVEAANFDSLPSVDASAEPILQPPTNPGSQNPYATSAVSSAQAGYQGGYQSPFASGGSSSGGALGVYRPLHEASFFLGFLAWGNIIMGGLFCLTIVGIIHGGIFLWLGLSLKGANDSLKAAFQTGNPQQLHAASNSLATYFKINGVLMMIGLGFAVLYLLFAVVVLIIAASSGGGGF